MTGFKDEMENVYDVNEKFDKLWAQYDPNSSAYEMMLFKTRLISIAYLLSAESYEIVKRSKDEDLLNRFKQMMTILSYGLTVSSLFIAPEVFFIGLPMSVFLSAKKTIDKIKSTEYLTPEQQEELNAVLYDFEEKSDEAFKIIDSRIDFLTSDEELAKVTDKNEYNYRKANKLIIDLLYDGQMENPNNDVKEEMIKLIQRKYNITTDDFEELLSIAYENFEVICDDLINNSERARKLARIPKRKWN